MAHNSIRRTAAIHVRASVLEARWQKLCALYLPRAPQDSMWRYAKGGRRRQPSSGWTLHISATILSASTVLNRTAPFLIGRGVSFKAPRSLMEVGKLNSGLDYNYSQIGKIITVYPRSDAEAVFLAQRLHKLTRRMSAPTVPFDLRFSDTSNVYYRFGAFQHLELTRNGQQVPAVNTPDGNLIPDIREQPKPDWASDPFVIRRPRSRPVRQKAASSILVVKALVQRGKGGVYVAIDFSSGSPRPCLLKEGRKNGELTWDGRDGAWRIRNEKQVLRRLLKRGVPVPRVQSSFEMGGNRYLVMQYLDGETLHDTLLRRHRRLAVSRVLDYAIQLAKFISQMHGVGWAWRDCKPKNLIVTRDGRLLPIDFEGATPLNRLGPPRWGTPGFTPAQSRDRKVGNAAAEDLYGMGATLFLLLTGRVFDPAERLSIQKLRRGVPPTLRQLVNSLLSDESEIRPTAAATHATLTSNFLNLKRPAKSEEVAA